MKMLDPQTLRFLLRTVPNFLGHVLASKAESVPKDLTKKQRRYRDRRNKIAAQSRRINRGR